MPNRVNNDLKFIFFMLAVLSQLHTGTCLKCYQCNSHSDASCDGTPDKKYIMECSSSGKEVAGCRKIVQEIDFEVNGLSPDKRTVRSCAYSVQDNDPNKCYQRSGFGGKQLVCACSSDECNASDRIIITHYGLLAAVSILPILRMFVQV